MRFNNLPKSKQQNILREVEEAKQGTKCLSDRVLNYIQLLVKKFNVTEETKQFALNLYMNLRVDGYFGTGKNPLSQASAIFYISTLVTSRKHPSQEEISCSIGILPETLGTNYRKLAKILKEKGEI